MEGHLKHCEQLNLKKNDGSFEIFHPISIWKLFREDKVVWSSTYVSHPYRKIGITQDSKTLEEDKGFK